MAIEKDGEGNILVFFIPPAVVMDSGVAPLFGHVGTETGGALALNFGSDAGGIGGAARIIRMIPVQLGSVDVFVEIGM